MNEILLQVWIILGIVLIIGEFLLPGLVVVFVGLASLTVALLLYMGLIDHFSTQLLVFFTSSIFYLLSLRFLVLKLVPSNTEKANVNEDEQVFGSVVEVVETIENNCVGRIIHSDSSWQAKAEDSSCISKGEKVMIIGRENITWIVQRL